MRIIGNLDRRPYKITVFQNEGRLSIKFERDGLEQTYKFRDQDGFRTFSDAERLVDEKWMLDVHEQFAGMERSRVKLWQRHAPEGEDEFEVIV